MCVCVCTFMSVCDMCVIVCDGHMYICVFTLHSCNNKDILHVCMCMNPHMYVYMCVCVCVVLSNGL